MFCEGNRSSLGDLEPVLGFALVVRQVTLFLVDLYGDTPFHKTLDVQAGFDELFNVL
jgi:hypothetical protein